MKKKMNKKVKKAVLLFIFSLLLGLLSIPSVYGIISISCEDCSLGNCKCNSDCSSGFLDIYQKKCQGAPKYEIPIFNGAVKWSPYQEGNYYSKILCDSGEKSSCETITVISQPYQQSAIKGKENFSYLLALSLILISALLIYKRYYKKSRERVHKTKKSKSLEKEEAEELENVKKKVLE